MLPHKTRHSILVLGFKTIEEGNVQFKQECYLYLQYEIDFYNFQPPYRAGYSFDVEYTLMTALFEYIS
jgi:hypothetical protein